MNAKTHSFTLRIESPHFDMSTTNNNISFLYSGGENLIVNKAIEKSQKYLKFDNITFGAESYSEGSNSFLQYYRNLRIVN